MGEGASNALPRPANVRIRPLALTDLPTLFEHQNDREGAAMAVVVPRSREEYFAHWTRLLTTPPLRLVARAIEVEGVLVGTVNFFQRPGVVEEGATVDADGKVVGELDYVGYMLGREHWGRGIMTRALGALLEEVKDRPVRARAARTNVASVKVLERCGFVRTGYWVSPAGDPRFPVCEEVLFRLG